MRFHCPNCGAPNEPAGRTLAAAFPCGKCGAVLLVTLYRDAELSYIEVKAIAVRYEPGG